MSCADTWPPPEGELVRSLPYPLGSRARQSQDVSRERTDRSADPQGPLTPSPAIHIPVHRSRCRREPEGDCSPSSAFQDRDFLENEQFFLETLKKASYNMASHSA